MYLSWSLADRTDWTIQLHNRPILPWVGCRCSFQASNQPTDGWAETVSVLSFFCSMWQCLPHRRQWVPSWQGSLRRSGSQLQVHYGLAVGVEQITNHFALNDFIHIMLLLSLGRPKEYHPWRSWIPTEESSYRFSSLRVKIIDSLSFFERHVI